MTLEGKTILKTKEVWGESTQLLFTDGTFIIVHRDYLKSDELELSGEPEKGEAKPKAEKPKEEAKPKAEAKAEAKEEKPKEEVAASSDDFNDPWTADELEEMNREQLIETIDDEELKIDPKDFKTTEALCDAIIDELVD